MNRLFIGTILILATAAVAFWGIWARWEKISQERVKIAELTKLSDELTAIRARYEALLGEYNAVPAADLAKLEVILPQGPENARLLIDFETIARKNGIVLPKLDLVSSQEQAMAALPLASQTSFAALPFSMEVKGTYTGFRSFLTDLEEYVRLTDITEIKLGSGESGSFQANLKGKVYYQR